MAKAITGRSFTRLAEFDPATLATILTSRRTVGVMNGLFCIRIGGR